MLAVITALGTMAAIIGVGWLLGHRGTLGAGGLPILAKVCFPVTTPAPEDQGDGPTRGTRLHSPEP